MATEYDVAISFAGEDRALAEGLADLLANEFQLSVFFDDYEQANLWGRFLEEKLLEIYRDKAQFCVVLVSKHYKIKRWTQHEWRSAQERALAEPDKDLPIRLDDTILDGLLETMGFVDGRQHQVRAIARLIYQRVGDFGKLANIVRLADQAYREGRIDEALQLVSDSKFDGDVDALRVRANSLAKKTRYTEAIAAFGSIVSMRPKDFLAHFHLGIYCYRTRNYRRSVEHYEIADGLSPGHPTIESDLPEARRRLEEIGGASDGQLSLW